MKRIYSYNPPEIAFHIWVCNFPFSGHPLDDRRFYSFVLTVYKYKTQGQRWRKKSYFIKKIREYGYQVKEDEIVKKYEEMILILDYLESKVTPVFRKKSLLNEESFESGSIFLACSVVDKKLVYKEISESNYKNNKVNKKTFAK